MLTREQSEQLDEYERNLDNEYRTRKEGIRFMREFLSAAGAPSKVSPNLLSLVPPISPNQMSAYDVSGDLPPLDIDDGPTLIGKVSEVMERYSTEKWTMRRMLAYLQKLNFPIRNNKPEASISAALSKLAKSGRITAVRPGAGKALGIYQWNPDYKPPALSVEHNDILEEGGEALTA